MKLSPIQQQQQRQRQQQQQRKNTFVFNIKIGIVSHSMHAFNILYSTQMECRFFSILFSLPHSIRKLKVAVLFAHMWTLTDLYCDLSCKQYSIPGNHIRWHDTISELALYQTFSKSPFDFNESSFTWRRTTWN